MKDLERDLHSSRSAAHADAGPADKSALDHTTDLSIDMDRSLHAGDELPAPHQAPVSPAPPRDDAHAPAPDLSAFLGAEVSVVEDEEDRWWERGPAGDGTAVGNGIRNDAAVHDKADGATAVRTASHAACTHVRKARPRSCGRRTNRCDTRPWSWRGK